MKTIEAITKVLVDSAKQIQFDDDEHTDKRLSVDLGDDAVITLSTNTFHQSLVLSALNPQQCVGGGAPAQWERGLRENFRRCVSDAMVVSMALDDRLQCSLHHVQSTNNEAEIAEKVSMLEQQLREWQRDWSTEDITLEIKPEPGWIGG